MSALLTLSVPGLVPWVSSIIDSTNYRGMMTVAQFLRAGVARLYGDDHAALDVLFDDLHREHPELKEWPYEDEDDLLLANHLLACKYMLEAIMVPMLPNDAIARYYTHSTDTLTVLED